MNCPKCGNELREAKNREGYFVCDDCDSYFKKRVKDITDEKYETKNSLITCTECGKEFSHKATACPNCACPTSEIISKTEPEKKGFWDIVSETAAAKKSSQHKEIGEIKNEQRKVYTGGLKCPKCKGRNIQTLGSTKKPLSLGKGIAGGLLIGPMGAVGGAIIGNKGKYEVFCLDCGKRWKVK